MMRAIPLLAGCLLVSCGGQQLPRTHDKLDSHVVSTSTFVAGAARVDVTPPPGASMFGHGPGAGVSVGYWTRLLCRAFYLQSDAALRDPLAIVSCDLPNISVLLHRAVARRLPAIPAARLMITATHTHAGPGHYTEGSNFGSYGSAFFPGFDPQMVEFLATRIASAVESARIGAAPARLRWVRDEVWGLTRNRSLLPHAANSHPATWESPADITALGQAYQAIDPNLRVLQLETVDENGQRVREIGSLTFFAMHPTVIGRKNPFFGGDVYGVVARRVEAARAADSVHAILNTNEGDVSAARGQGTPSEAIQLGCRLGDAIAQSLATEDSSESAKAWQREPALGMRYLEESLPGAAYFVDEHGNTSELCPFPMLGTDAIVGAEDHPTLFNDLLPLAGWRGGKPAGGCHGPKRKFSEGGFPEHLPLGLARIGDTWISFVPGEPTITSGQRINDAVLEIARSQVPAGRTADAVVAGLANGYILYIATPEEYALQHYEGASTLYGPDTATFLASRYAFLALHLAKPEMTPTPTANADAVIDVAGAFPYEIGPRRERLWRKERDVPLEALAAARRPESLCRVPSIGTPIFCARWDDGGPAAVSLSSGVYVEVVGCAAPGCIAQAVGSDDYGWEFHTRVHFPVGDAYRWSTLYEPTPETWKRVEGMSKLHIRVRGRGSVAPIDLPVFAQAPVCSAPLLAGECSLFRGPLHDEGSR